MLDKEDLQAISQLMDVKLAPIQEDLSSVKDRVTSIEGRMDRLEETVTRVALTQENVVLPAINALAEGHELIHQELKRFATKEEVQDVRDQFQVLQTVVASHSRDIEQLKMAQ